MLDVLDGRTDVCAPFGGYHRDDARLMHSPNNEVVVKGKLVILKALGNFFSAAQNDRVSKLIKFWERTIEDGLGLSSWDDAQASMVVGAPAQQTSRAGDKSGSMLSMSKVASKVYPTKLTLGAFANDPTRCVPPPPCRLQRGVWSPGCRLQGLVVQSPGSRL